MKTCQACSTPADDAAATCAACGQGSWSATTPTDGGSPEPASPAPSDPVGEPDTLMPRHMRRRR
jgi:hypothetical protein